MPLPILVTPADVETTVAYLRSKPAGVSREQAAAVLKQVLDERKLAGYLRWVLVKIEDGKLKLHDRGSCLARSSKSLETVMREIIDGETAYRSALEWIYHQKMDSVASSDVASYWGQHYPEEVGTGHDRRMTDQALCFFRVTEAAGLGRVVIGRRGAPTSLEVSRLSLSHFIEGRTAETSASSASTVDGEIVGRLREQQERPTVTQSVPSSLPVSLDFLAVPPTPLESRTRPRVFIAHGKNRKLVKQVEDILTQVAGFECEVAVKDEETAIPVSEKVFGAMKRCTASVIIVSREAMLADPDANRINENVLIEIGCVRVVRAARCPAVGERGTRALKYRGIIPLRIRRCGSGSSRGDQANEGAAKAH